MSDSVEVVESKRNSIAVETAIQQWLNDNSDVTSIEHVTKAYEMNDRVGVAIIYTA